MTSVVIASSRNIVSDGIRGQIEKSCSVAQTATSSLMLMFLAGASEPDVCFMDFGGKRDEWDEALTALVSMHPNVKVIALVEPEDVGKLIARCGERIDGYLSLSSPQGELQNALNDVLDGREYVCPVLQPVVGSATEADSMSPHEALTPRQLEILAHLARGKSAKEIAAELDVSKRTIEFHKYRIMRRLGVERSAQMVQYAVEHGLLD